jgi:hypothetical protein
MKKKWWKSKTLWLNTALASGTVIEANLGILRDAMGPSAYLGVVGLAAASNAALRFFTSEPVGK